MYDHVSVGFITKFCSQAGQTVRIPTRISTAGDSFYAGCDGCDFSCGLPVCEECRAVNQLFWKELHLKHPDLSASRLTALPPEELP